MDTKFKPVGNRIQIQPHELNKTKSGIYLTENTSTSYYEGTVLSISESIESLDIQIGDIVLYAKQVTTLEDGTHLVHPHNVYGKIVENISTKI